MVPLPPNVKDQQSPDDVSQPRSHNIIFKMPRVQSKITCHSKNHETMTNSQGKRNITDANIKIINTMC